MTHPIRHIPESPESRAGGGRRGRNRRRRPARAAVAAAVLLTALLGAAGCGSGGGSDGKSAVEAPAAQRDGGAGSAADGPAAGEAGAGDRAAQPGGTEDAAGPASPGDTRRTPASVPAHVIRTATLTVRVKDVPSALDTARTAAENAGGYISDETTDRDSDGRERSRLVLRIPQEKYTDLLEELAGTGELLERKVDAQDVTDQVVDVESRVKSQRASVARVRELMDRADKLSDIVTLEGELSTRQSELEALLAQRASLEDRTAMATVTLRLTETERAEKSEDELSFPDALAGGWHAFTTGLRWLAVAVGAVLPFAVALALILLLIRLAGRLLPDRAAGRERGPAEPAESAESAAEAASPAPAPAAPPAPGTAPGTGPAPSGRAAEE
ncbi:DUF4349 domain-containing protein [Streptomyces sp. WAC 00631]|uniref:DUF4349 domain-containing protein n=1 Tax=Streptomyces sp. WAC 00631 TaxID=2203201 RepID=UPI000F7B3961|nr:DUF4349 domain-containing protein [Streptomyces sp. WAC 00631]MCC5036108.1 DUF4349 domain-containing protein [Streptomyces sp. WAC 00631]